MSNIELDNLSFDQWVKFVFDHSLTEPPWYWDAAWDEFWDQWAEKSDPQRQLYYATRLFRSPDFLLREYNPEQINQGLWLLLSGPAAFRLGDLIWSKKLSWRARKECILVMVNLFQSVFTKLPEQDICFMWWDELRDWDFREDRDPRVRDSMFQALSLILKIPSTQCQMSALHGLGHLDHPEKRKVIEDYLQQNPQLDTEIKKYTQAAISGKVV